jgi:hypothetical protein
VLGFAYSKTEDKSVIITLHAIGHGSKDFEFYLRVFQTRLEVESLEELSSKGFGKFSHQLKHKKTEINYE